MTFKEAIEQVMSGYRVAWRDGWETPNVVSLGIEVDEWCDIWYFLSGIDGVGYLSTVEDRNATDWRTA